MFFLEEHPFRMKIAVNTIKIGTETRKNFSCFHGFNFKNGTLITRIKRGLSRK